MQVIPICFLLLLLLSKAVAKSSIIISLNFTFFLHSCAILYTDMFYLAIFLRGIFLGQIEMQQKLCNKFGQLSSRQRVRGITLRHMIYLHMEMPEDFLSHYVRYNFFLCFHIPSCLFLIPSFRSVFKAASSLLNRVVRNFSVFGQVHRNCTWDGNGFVHSILNATLQKLMPFPKGHSPVHYYIIVNIMTVIFVPFLDGSLI